MSSDDDKTRIGQDESVRKGVQLNGIFEIDELIATGGMGEVYRGHNIQTGDPVAIKVVLREFARDQGILALFRKEASILNHLSHDAIVRYHVFSIDPTINRPYLAMEFVDGQSLGERMHRGPIEAREAHRMLARLASGLSVAHEAGIIHRDLSPDNIVLPGGNVDKSKIIDFGIARSANIGGGTLIGGNFAGKYNFVSPEQLGLFGGDVTERSDIYSLGLVIAGALRGTPIDMNGSPVEVIEKRRTRPDLTSIDAELRPLLEAMLEPDPQDRTQSAADIVEWLRANSSRSLPPSALSAPPGRAAREATNSGPDAAGQRHRHHRSTTLPGERGHSPFGADSEARRLALRGAGPRDKVGTSRQRPPKGVAAASALLAGTALLLLLAAAGRRRLHAGPFSARRETTVVDRDLPEMRSEEPPVTDRQRIRLSSSSRAASRRSVPQWLAAFDGGPCFFAALDDGAARPADRWLRDVERALRCDAAGDPGVQRCARRRWWRRSSLPGTNARSSISSVRFAEAVLKGPPIISTPIG